jgi:5-methylcytosine-specific restriction endonuclease McrA
MFHKNNQRKSGLTTRCKECVSAYGKQHYQRVADQRKQRYKTDENYREAIKERSKQYIKVISKTDQYKEKARIKIRHKRATDPVYREKVNARKRKQRNGNQQYLCAEAERRHKRRALQKQNGHHKVSISEIARIKATPCVSCGSRDRITVDHIIPITRGGRHSIGNLQALCMPCNSSKNDKLMIEWKQQKAKEQV